MSWGDVSQDVVPSRVALRNIIVERKSVPSSLANRVHKENVMMDPKALKTKAPVRQESSSAWMMVKPGALVIHSNPPPKRYVTIETMIAMERLMKSWIAPVLRGSCGFATRVELKRHKSDYADKVFSIVQRSESGGSVGINASPDLRSAMAWTTIAMERSTIVCVVTASQAQNAPATLEKPAQNKWDAVVKEPRFVTKAGFGVPVNIR